MSTQIYRQNFWVGVACVVTGGVFAVNAWRNLDFGSLEEMGPGFFPIIVSTLFAVLGLAIAVRGYSEKLVEAPNMSFWRPAVVTVAIVAFGLTAERLGMVLSVAIASSIASLAVEWKGVTKIVMNVAAIVVFCVVVFHYALGLSLSLY